MKLHLVSVIAILCAPATFGQGTVNFANAGAGVNAPVLGQDGSRLEGDRWKVELLVGHNADSLTPVAMTSLLTGGGAGFYNGGVVTLAGHAPGSRPFFQVRIWDTLTGPTFDVATFKAATCPFQLATTLGGGGLDPAPRGLEAAGTCLFVPEPSSLALAIIAGVALVCGRLKRNLGI
jgi:hypothetical protein